MKDTEFESIALTPVDEYLNKNKVPKTLEVLPLVYNRFIEDSALATGITENVKQWAGTKWKEKLLTICGVFVQSGEWYTLHIYGVENQLAFSLPNKPHNKRRRGPVDTGIHISVGTPSIFMLERPSQNRLHLK